MLVAYVPVDYFLGKLENTDVILTDGLLTDGERREMCEEKNNDDARNECEEPQKMSANNQRNAYERQERRI